MAPLQRSLFVFGRRSLSSLAKGKDNLLKKNPDDVVIVWAKRSPLGKAYKGAFKDMRSDELLTSFFKAAAKDMPIKLEQLDDICVGIVQGPGNEVFARAAMLAAGYPDKTPIQVINRFCASGLMSISIIANQIRNHEIDIGLAMGAEALSTQPLTIIPPEGLSEEITNHKIAKDCLGNMGWTSENVAEQFDITRERMDALALLSHNRANKAKSQGVFKDEILPIEALQKSSEVQAGQQSPPKKTVLIEEDDGLRASTIEGLQKARSAFPQYGKGVSTGGNTSQITDGVAGIVLTRREHAEKLGLPILGKHIATSVVGLEPRIMGIAPAFAIPAILERTGIEKDQVDLFEINEAFMTMYVYTTEKLGLNTDLCNVNGGAVALGHPYGCTGTRQVVTGLTELNKREKDLLVTSMCIGLGMGAAGMFVGEGRR